VAGGLISGGMSTATAVFARIIHGKPDFTIGFKLNSRSDVVSRAQAVRLTGKARVVCSRPSLSS